MGVCLLLEEKRQSLNLNLPNRENRIGSRAQQSAAERSRDVEGSEIGVGAERGRC